MDPLVQSLGIPTGLAGWSVLQKTSITSFKQFTNDPIVKSDIAYFKANIGKATTAQKLLSNPRLQSFVLTAYGLDSQVGMTALMQKVMNSDTNQASSVARRMTDARYTTLAADFGYGTSAATATNDAVASSSTVDLAGLDGTNGFSNFTGTFGGVTLQNVDLSGAKSYAAVAAKLNAAFQAADGGSDITVTQQGLSLVFSDKRGRGAAENFDWTQMQGAYDTLATASAPRSVVNGHVTSVATADPAVASKAVVDLDSFTSQAGLSSFSGTVGGISVQNVDLSGATTRDAIAKRLNAAFQAADGGRTDIQVKLFGSSLQISDAKGRGAPTNFSWTPAQTSDGQTAQIPTLSGVISGRLATSLTETPAVATKATVTLDGVYTGNDFSSFSGTFGGVSLSNVNLSGATTRDEIAKRLNAAFKAADGGGSDIQVKVSGLELVFTDAQGRGASAADFSWTPGSGSVATASSLLVNNAGHVAIPAIAAQPSTADVALSGLTNGTNFLNFSGTFAGVTLKSADISTVMNSDGSFSSVADTPDKVASLLTAAFRKADGGRSDITVTATSDGELHFRDAAGRGTASNFKWTTSSAGVGAATPTNLTTGKAAQENAPNTGPSINDPDFVQKVIDKYLDAQFQKVVGNTSETLRTALYAKENLPTITNWYSVIADKNLASLIQTTLGLPSSFGQVNVDQQVNLLKAKMNIKDFQNPAKLSKLIDRYVALGSLNDSSTSTSTNPALVLLSAQNNVSYNMSSSSAVALLLST